MKLKLILIITALFSTSFLKAQSSFTDEQALKMLKSFYNEYISEISIMPMNEEKVQEIKTNFCTKNLLNKLNDKELDNDRFIEAQDCDIELLKKLNFKKKAKTENTFVVSYLDNASRKLISIELIVVKQDEIYKIEEIVEEKSKSFD
jgi:hypothetical protein